MSALRGDLCATWFIARRIMRTRMTNLRSYAFLLFFNTLDILTVSLAMVAITHTFGSLGGWHVPEVLMLVGITGAVYGLSMFLMGGFDTYQFFPMYQNGEFEAELQRPGNHILTIAAAALRPYRLGRIIMASAVFLTGFILSEDTTFWIFLILPLYVVIGSVMISSMWVIDASSSVLFGQLNDFTRNMPYTTMEAGMFPQDLYRLPVRYVTLYVMGIGSAAYLPLAFLLHKNSIGAVWSFFAAPVVMCCMLLVARVFWVRAIAHYESS